MMIRRRDVVWQRVIVAMVLISMPSFSHGLTFEFTTGPTMSSLESSGTPAEMAAVAGLKSSATKAAAAYTSMFDDPITIKFELEVKTLTSASTIGFFDVEAPGIFSTFDYASEIKPMLIADVTTPDDATSVASLHPGPSLFMVTNDTLGTPSPRITLSPDIPALGDGMFEMNTAMRLTRANQKALDLLPGGDGADGADGTIVINTPFLSTTKMDFDPSDGTGPTMVDAVTFLMHEMGHGMGFVSGVDEVDFAGEAAPIRFRADYGTLGDVKDDAIFSVLDLHRYSPDSLGKAEQPATGATLDLAFGPPTGGGIKPFFSIDGGATAITKFSTGMFNGDAFQASHWEDIDPMSTGLMDPDASDGESIMLSDIDKLAFDVIGYNFVPEPRGCLLAMICLTSILHFRRRLPAHFPVHIPL